MLPYGRYGIYYYIPSYTDYHFPFSTMIHCHIRIDRGQRIGAGHSPGSGIGRGLPWDRSQAKARQSKPSAKDLDAELERYHSQAVKTKRPALV